MVDIKPFTSEFDEYRKDESRTVGTAESISFPRSEREVREVLAHLAPGRVPVTVQGGRTGLAAGAVPRGGHAMNLSKMNRCLGMRRGPATAGVAASQTNTSGLPARETLPCDTYFLRVEPGVVLAQLRKDLEDKNVRTAGWDAESLAAWEAFCQDERTFFFPTDPTETSATIGGMATCNASGARSYRFGPMRPHVTALRVALADGDLLDLRRGAVRARGRSLDLETEGGRRIHVDLPTYDMPRAKNASGYYAADGMDAVDLFVGSDGTLGVITEIELELAVQPPVIWGVSCFFDSEDQAVAFTVLTRANMPAAAAIEYFDHDALAILRRQKATSTAFASLPDIDPETGCCIYVELQCRDEAAALEGLYRLGALLEQAGGSERDTWVGRTDLDRESQRFFRHAVPESVNMLIDKRRKTDPSITKLGSDMAVPDEHLLDVVRLYRTTLRAEGLQTAVWGHIGNNHLHVNVLPRSAEEHRHGKELFTRWAQAVTEMGGAVSAEHGVGKLKRDFLATMYGEKHVREMARVKRQLDPQGILGRGNLFPEELLDEPGEEA